MEDYIHQEEFPMEEVVEIKSGQRKVVNRVRMPGYVLVRMDLTDESWGAVRHAPGATGFVGQTHQPVPLTIEEVVQMLNPQFETGRAAEEAAPVHTWVHYEVGESDHVVDGPVRALP